jgi:organic hydroperoxide reductase OsmC/OhrA
MSEHKAEISWKRATEAFDYASYSRDHEWRFSGGHVVPGSAAPEFRGNADRVDPESAFVASLSSCHMLSFLAICARKRFVVDAYEDHAVGHLEKNAEGKLAMTRVELRPRTEFSGEKRPTPEELHTLHEQAHRECFIANSVTADVRVEA